MNSFCPPFLKRLSIAALLLLPCLAAKPGFSSESLGDEKGKTPASWVEARDSSSEVRMEEALKYYKLATKALAPDQKQALYTKAIHCDARFTEAYVNRGIAEGRRGELEAAFQDFEKAIALSPKDPLPLLNRAYAFLLNDDLDHAIADYCKAINLDKKNPSAYNSLGFVYYLKGEKGKALENFDEAIRLDPKEPLYYLNRAKLKKETGNASGAEADLKKFKELNSAGK